MKALSQKARLGQIKTKNGTIDTPIFMPVGTGGAVKTLSPADLDDIGVQIILSNTYHLFLRPGDELISRMGGLHKFMSWKKPILTDSGGFQVMSLQGLTKITEQGVHFRSHLDGSPHLFTPERVIDIQRNIGADIIMAFDECPSFPATKAYIATSMELTLRWAKRCLDHYYLSKMDDQALFGIVQGGVYEDMREECARRLMEMNFPGYAIGGLAVGEGKEDLYRVVSFMNNVLPADKPRYLMGVGTPLDLVTCVANGIDMFDCVMPTRNARKGTVFTSKGKLILKAARYKEDTKPIDDNCGCYTCLHFSRAYLRHLFNTNEMLALRLASLHSIYYYMKLMESIREAIREDHFADLYKEIVDVYRE